MKKRLWFLVLPVVLLTAMLWTRRESWKRTDAEFRQVMLQQTKEGSEQGVLVSIGTPSLPLQLGVLTPEQLAKMLLDVHLEPASKQKTDLSKMTLHFDDLSNTSRDAVSFFIVLDGEESDILTVDTSGDSMLQKWNDFQLTPESVRLLKKRIMTLYGKQIEDFKRRAKP